MNRYANTQPHIEQERGNALVIILIAVVLFAALSFAVSGGLRGGNKADDENLAVKSTQILEYARTIKAAINQMQLLNDCSDTDISFTHPAWGHTDYDHTPATDIDCQVFHDDGGGVTWQSSAGTLSDLPWEFISDHRVHGVGTTESSDGNTSDRELLMALPGLSADMCDAINDQLGHGFSSIPIDGGAMIDGSLIRFSGTYGTNENISGDPSSTCPNPLCYKSSGCFQEEDINEYYIFYKVLIAR